MVTTCALRVSAFLAHVQTQFDQIQDLEQKPIDEIVALVEGIFWTTDPLICLWEEVQGSNVRIRLGPYSIDNFGTRRYDTELGPGFSDSNGEWLRVPLWTFCPSIAHFRCLAEWSLLDSERLARALPRPGQSKHGGGCCCVPCRRPPKSGQGHAKEGNSR